jgi:DNA-directed RNA polymerase specialized sigma24 family protein
MAVYALVTACLLFDKLRRLGQLGSLIEMMVKIAAEDPTPELPFDTWGDARDKEAVFALDGRMCEVAGAINGLEQFPRELLVLHHIERLEVATLADAHDVSVDDIRRALAEAEGQFVELLRGLSAWDDETGPDVHALLVELADCIDLPWAESLGEFALHYAADWNG